jgi:hypothetical protein
MINGHSGVARFQKYFGVVRLQYFYAVACPQMRSPLMGVSAYDGLI